MGVFGNIHRSSFLLIACKQIDFSTFNRDFFTKYILTLPFFIVYDRNQMNKTYKYLGTLGDSFVAFSKVYDQATVDNPITLKRYAYPYDEIETAVSGFFQLLPQIRYERIMTHSQPLEEALRQDPAPFIITGEAPQDFLDKLDNNIAHLKQHPYPIIPLNPGNKQTSSIKKIGIQLHAGKTLGRNNKNYKGLSLDWLQQLSQHICPSQFEIALFGTGHGYNKTTLEQFCTKNHLKNFVGKQQFSEWLIGIQECDFFISPDGFSAYFSCSQHIPTMIFYNDPLVRGYRCPEWAEISYWKWQKPSNKWQSRLCRFFGHPYQRYSPFLISEIQTFIQSHLGKVYSST